MAANGGFCFVVPDASLIHVGISPKVNSPFSNMVLDKSISILATTRNLTIHCNPMSSSRHIQIIDLKGKTMAHAIIPAGIGMIKINKVLTRGMYVAKIGGENNGTKQFIVQ
jgi:hypothetical protein